MGAGAALIKFIIQRTVKNSEKVNDVRVREGYGILSGILGIICNLSLFSAKLIAGLIIDSIAIISDAFNNLSDLGASLVTIFGAKLSNVPADKEHPQGHGRMEYVASLIVAFIIFGVGFQLINNSVDRITNPKDVSYSILTIIILIASILIKLWMYSYNRYIGRRINSSVIRAASSDSLNDVIATAAVAAGTIAGKYIDFPIDGVIGLVISLLIMYTGFTIAKDSVNLILGKHDPELMHKIYEYVLRGKGVIGIHDLIIHDYGPGRVIASVHAEFSGNNNLLDAHDEIDRIEQQIEKDLSISIVIHIDPLESSEKSE